MAVSGLPAYLVIDQRHNERLIQALVVSLAIHAVILAMKFHLPPPSQLNGGTAMSVTLISPMEVVSGSVQAVLQETGKKSEQSILTQKSASTFDVGARGTKAQQSTQVQQIELKKSGAAKLIQSDAGANTVSGAESRYVHKPGEARVILEVNSDGQIGQIIWDLLPAMTDEQFNRLEAALRKRGYVGPSTNAFIRQTIDVREFIGTSAQGSSAN